MKELTFAEELFIQMAGQDPETVSKCGADEIIRVKIRGRAILVPTILAFIGAFILVYVESGSYIVAVLGGVAWMTIVYINDNSIMATGDNKKVSWPVFFRIMLAIFTSLIFGEGLLAMLFNDSIQEQQQFELDMHQRQVDSLYDPQIQSLNKEWNIAKADLRKKENGFIAELDGSGGTKKRGLGVVALNKRNMLANERTKYSADSTRYNQRLVELLKRKEAAYKLAEESQAKGASGSLGSLNRIRHSYLRWAIWIIRLALLFVDLIPIFIKFSSSKKSDLYGQLVALESEGIRDMALINRKMEQEVMKEKKTYVSAEAKIKAGYDHHLSEMDMYSKFTREAVRRWQQESEFHARGTSPEFGKSKEAEAIKLEFERMWGEKSRPAA